MPLVPIQVQSCYQCLSLNLAIKASLCWWRHWVGVAGVVLCPPRCPPPLLSWSMPAAGSIRSVTWPLSSAQPNWASGCWRASCGPFHRCRDPDASRIGPWTRRPLPYMATVQTLCPGPRLRNTQSTYEGVWGEIPARSPATEEDLGKSDKKTSGDWLFHLMGMNGRNM